MSQIAIWNLALGRLGDGGTVGAPDERSRQAELCRQFYPLARRSVLEMRDWNFATRIAHMAPVATPLVGAWCAAHAFPANALRVFRVGDYASLLSGADAKGADFEVLTDGNGVRLVLSDQPEAAAKFTVDVVDEARWSPLFTDAMTWYLAATLAGPLLLGETGRNQGRAMLQEFRLLLGEATVSDANQKQDRSPDQHAAPWMQGRGLSRPEAQPPYPRWIRPDAIHTETAAEAEPFDFAAYYNNLPSN